MSECYQHWVLGGDADAFIGEQSTHLLIFLNIQNFYFNKHIVVKCGHKTFVKRYVRNGGRMFYSFTIKKKEQLNFTSPWSELWW